MNHKLILVSGKKISNQPTVLTFDHCKLKATVRACT